MDGNYEFRGKGMGGHWMYGFLTKKKIRSSGELRYAIAHDDCSLVCTVPVHENTIGQFTGAYDCDGKKIYEGDICIFTSKKEKTKYIITWNAYRWDCINPNDNSDSGAIWFDDIKVVGNIYENKDLLGDNNDKSKQCSQHKRGCAYGGYFRLRRYRKG